MCGAGREGEERGKGGGAGKEKWEGRGGEGRERRRKREEEQGRREEEQGAPPALLRRVGPAGAGVGADPGRGRGEDPSGRRRGWEGGLGGTRWPQGRRGRRRVPGHRPCREPWDRARTRKVGRARSPALPRTRGQPGRNQRRGLCLPSLPPPPAHTCNARHTPVNRKVLWENVVHRCRGLFLILSLEGRQVKIL